MAYACGAATCPHRSSRSWDLELSAGGASTWTRAPLEINDCAEGPLNLGAISKRRNYFFFFAAFFLAAGFFAAFFLAAIALPPSRLIRPE